MLEGIDKVVERIVTKAKDVKDKDERDKLIDTAIDTVLDFTPPAALTVHIPDDWFYIESTKPTLRQFVYAWLWEKINNKLDS